MEHRTRGAGRRCLLLSTALAGAMALAEALRQTGLFPAFDGAR